MSLPQVPNGAVNAEVIINQLFAALGHALTYCHDYRLTGGLIRGYLGGDWKGFTVADLTHTFGASTTTYVAVDRSDGSLDFSTSSTNYDDLDNFARVEVVVTGGTGVTSVTDGRADEGGVHESGGSAGAGTSAERIAIAVSDETTAITTGAGKVTFRMPCALTLTEVRASVSTAPTGAALVIDINEGGSSILSTKLSIDAGEKTSTTAAAPAVISDASLADDAEITIDFDQVGSSVAGAGVKVWLIGTAP